jgi:hypothetical protein
MIQLAVMDYSANQSLMPQVERSPLMQLTGSTLSPHRELSLHYSEHHFPALWSLSAQVAVEVAVTMA